MSENLRIAVVSAAAAVIGALAGGGAAYLATSASERAEDRRAERHANERVRGAARYLMSEFTGASTHAGSMLESGEVLHLGSSFRVEMRAEDMQLVLSRLAPNETRAVMGALTVDLVLGRLVTEKPDGARLGEAGREIVATAEGALDDAVDALRRAAQVGQGDPPFRQSRTVPFPP